MEDILDNLIFVIGMLAFLGAIMINDLFFIMVMGCYGYGYGRLSAIKSIHS